MCPTMAVKLGNKIFDNGKHMEPVASDTVSAPEPVEPVVSIVSVVSDPLVPTPVFPSLSFVYAGNIEGKDVWRGTLIPEPVNLTIEYNTIVAQYEPSSTVSKGTNPLIENIDASFALVKSWEEGDHMVYQLDVTLTNCGKGLINSIGLEFDPEELVSTWCLQGSGSSYTVPGFGLPLAGAGTFSFGGIFKTDSPKIVIS